MGIRESRICKNSFRSYPQQPTNEKKTAGIQKKETNSVTLKNSISSNLAFPDREMNLTVNKPRRLSVTTIRIAIKKSSEQEKKLQELMEKLNNSEKGSKIRLILSTFSEDEAAMLKLQTQFFKNFCPYITYLQWEISGNFSDAGQAKAIGNILRRLVHLYSLDLFINNIFFADKGAESLGAGLSKLKDLHVLKLHINNFFRPLKQKGKQHIIEAIAGMTELEILSQNIQSYIFPFPPKLARQNISLYWFLYGNQNSNTLQWIIDRKSITVEVILGGYDMFVNEEEEELQETELTAFRQLFTELLEFPYLTRLEQFLEQTIGKEMRKILKLRDKVAKLANERYKMILNILIFDLVISELLPFNPQLILVDMLFD